MPIKYKRDELKDQLSLVDVAPGKVLQDEMLA